MVKKQEWFIIAPRHVGDVPARCIGWRGAEEQTPTALHHAVGVISPRRGGFGGLHPHQLGRIGTRRDRVNTTQGSEPETRFVMSDRSTIRSALRMLTRSSIGFRFHV